MCVFVWFIVWCLPDSLHCISAGSNCRTSWVTLADPNFAWEKQYYVGVVYWGHVWRAFANKLLPQLLLWLLSQVHLDWERERQRKRERRGREVEVDGETSQTTYNNQLATLLLLPVVVVVVLCCTFCEFFSRLKWFFGQLVWVCVSLPLFLSLCVLGHCHVGKSENLIYANPENKSTTGAHKYLCTYIYICIINFNEYKNSWTWSTRKTSLSIVICLARWLCSSQISQEKSSESYPYQTGFVPDLT